jgi:hypothetical protein
MTEHPDPNLERRFAERLRRDLEAGLPSLDPADAARVARSAGGFRVSRAVLGVVTVLVAAALTFGALRLLGPIGPSTASGTREPTPSPTAAPTPSATAGVDLGSIIRVAPGENVQVGPASENLLHAFDQAWTFAQSHADDLGYPWVDPNKGELVLSAVTARGRTLLESEAAGFSVPVRVREVTHSFAELQGIQDDVFRLRAEGVPDANLIYQTSPDHRDNRTLIVMSAESQPLLEALAQRYGADAIAVEVDPSRGPGGTAGG